MHFLLSQLDVNAFTFDFMVETSLFTTKRGMNMNNYMQNIVCFIISTCIKILYNQIENIIQILIYTF